MKKRKPSTRELLEEIADMLRDIQRSVKTYLMTPYLPPLRPDEVVQPTIPQPPYYPPPEPWRYDPGPGLSKYEITCGTRGV